MKKRIISAVLSAAMLGTSVFSVPFVNAETDTSQIKDLEQIADLLNDYVEENHPGDARVVIEDEKVVVVFRKTSVSEDEFDGSSIYENMAEYLEENNVDPIVLTTSFLCECLDDAKEETVYESGDIDASGTIDVSDLTELSLALIGDRILTADQQIAADIDGDGAITLADLAKLRQYLSKKINKREFCNITLESIVDITERDGLSIPAAIEKFYEDEYCRYEFGGIKSAYVECTFSDGTKMNVKEALESGMVTISDLDKYKIDYRRTAEMTAVVKEVKGDTLFLIPAENSYELRSSDLFMTDYNYADQLFKAGDTVKVEYDGFICETYPAQITPYRISVYNS